MLFSVSFDTEITLFWDKPADAPAGLRYLVSEGARTVAAPDRTHVTLTGLSPDSIHTYTVTAVRAEGEAFALLGDITVKTAPVRPTVDVTAAPYGAVGDGKTLDTAAVQRAIDDCPAGGRVYFPDGTYLTGALNLHGDMELLLAPGATLQGTDRPEDYLPHVKSRFEGREYMCYRSLLNLGEMDSTGGPTVGRVTIRGGKIFGGGRTLAEACIKRDTPDMPLECLDENGHIIPANDMLFKMNFRVRGRLFSVCNAEDVTIAHTELGRGPAWNVHFVYSRRVVTFDCAFRSENVWNGDGWDPDSSEDCSVFGCTFRTGDDSVAVKSGKNPDGNIVGRPTKNIRIFDCVGEFGHGLTVGSEMSGGVDGVYIWDCDMNNTLYGVEIKGTSKRGGYIRNVHVSDSSLCRFLMHAVPYNNDGEAATHMPVFENCTVNRCTLTGLAHAVSTTGALMEHGETFFCDPVEIIGFSEEGCRVRNVTLTDIRVERRPDGEPHRIALDLCEGITVNGISVK